ncbi:MAG: hypothetical protein M3Q52_04365 [Pseudomonadota bacterium]|nr:hypothetical protein [Pseudomonadota bacterium]
MDTGDLTLGFIDQVSSRRAAILRTRAQPLALASTELMMAQDHAAAYSALP